MNVKSKMIAVAPTIRGYELYDNNSTMNVVKKWVNYFKKRGYLDGYITKLKRLEDEGRVVIHEILRTGIGSLFIEGYSIISWSPVEKV